MKLDVIIATYNRAGLLRHALSSLEAARLPDDMTARVIIADNRSRDQTRAVVEEFGREAKLPVLYLFCDRKQGKSAAINDALAHATGDLVGFIDDDEKVREDWFSVIYQCFQDKHLGLLGGPYVADLDAPLPKWVPKQVSAVLGITEPPAAPVEYSSFGSSMPWGGNVIYRRSLLNQVGGFREDLGPTDKHLRRCEDAEIFLRVLALGARGIHHPKLVIYHHVHRARLSKTYFRKCIFWNGVSDQRVEALHCKSSFWFGIPRWRFRASAAALFRRVFRIIRPEEQKFSDELMIIDLLGRLYSHWHNPDTGNELNTLD